MKPTRVFYFNIIPKCRLKVELYGKVRDEVVSEIRDTIHYIPEDYKHAFQSVKVLRIFHKKNHNKTTAFWDPKDNSININDMPTLHPFDYSQTFLHEFAHLLFHILSDLGIELDEDENGDLIEYDSQEEQDEANPFWAFVNEVNSRHIKPISAYAQHHKKEIKSAKGFKEFTSKVAYANELFAEYFGFTYCRFTDEDEVIGTFCNYIELRNAFWRLVDGFDIGSPNGKFV